MTQEKWGGLIEGDKIRSKDGSDEMNVVMYDFCGVGKEICFTSKRCIYPRDELDCNDWNLVRNGIVEND